MRDAAIARDTASPNSGADAGEPGIDRLAALARSYLFEGISADDLEPLARAATMRQVERGEPLWRIGDPADEICVVVRGEVKDSVVNLDGDEIVHYVHGAGRTLGEPGFFAIDRVRIVGVVATERSTVLWLHRRDLEPFLAAHPQVKDRVIERLASDNRWQTNLISALMTRPLVDRLVLRLLELADTNPEPGPIAATPRISQSLLAAMVGVSRENVNRALGALVDSKLVRRVDGRYEIVDEQALRRIASRDWAQVALRDRPRRV